jgi:4-amino-4-deoxy-L-arabinose transferase-like glycosyltransferase
MPIVPFKPVSDPGPIELPDGYDGKEWPPQFQWYSWAFGVLSGLGWLSIFAGGPGGWFPVLFVLAVILFIMMHNRNNFARILLIIITLPIGLILLGKKPRAYCNS